MIHEGCLGGLGLFEPRPHTARVLYSFDASAGCLVQELEADAGASVGCLVPREELSEESFRKLDYIPSRQLAQLWKIITLTGESTIEMSDFQ